jgi:hypothetical protein
MAEAGAAPAAQTSTSAIFPAVAEMERLESEKARLALELSDLSAELKDTLTTNDELLVDLNDKNDLLVVREKKLTEISDKNSNELKQLKLELECVQDHYKYELDIREKRLVLQQEKRRRFMKVKEENELLVQTFDDMNQELSNMEIQHAITLHEMNKDMSVVRQNLEVNLRRELVAMDLKYQQRAFASLSENFKKDIFENSKLKDEVTLQSIGIANLTLRLERQQFDTKKGIDDIHVLNRKAYALREALAVLSSEKNQELRAKNSSETKVQELEKKRDELTAAVNAPPQYINLEQDIERVKTSIQEERLKILMWQQRLKMLYEIDDAMIPTSKGEKQGVYSAQHFTFSTTAKSRSSTGTRTLTESMDTTIPENTQSEIKRVESNYSMAPEGDDECDAPVRIDDIERAVAKDTILASALRGMKGKESTMVGGKKKENDEEEQTQNMMSWLMTEILNVWKVTAAVDQERKQNILLDTASNFEDTTGDFIAVTTKEQDDYDLNKEFGDGEYDPFGGSSGITHHTGVLGDEDEYPMDVPDALVPEPEHIPGTIEESVEEDNNEDDMEDPYLVYKREEEAAAAAVEDAPEQNSPEPSEADEEINADMNFLKSLKSRVDDRKQSVDSQPDEDGLIMGQTGADLVESYRSVSSAVAALHDDFYNAEERTQDQEAIDEFLLDELLADSKLKEADDAPWYRMREEPLPLPKDIHVGINDPNVNFHYDSIKPAPITFDVGPPVREGKVKLLKKGNALSSSTSSLPSASKMSMSKVNSTTTLKRALKSQPDFVSTQPRIMKTGSGMNLIMPVKLTGSRQNSASTSLNKLGKQQKRI